MKKRLESKQPNPEKADVRRVVNAAIVRGGKLLLLRVVPEHSFLGVHWEAPGGLKMPGESDRAALRRLVREEAGIEVKHAKQVASWNWKIPSQNLVLDGVTYFCETTGEATLANDSKRKHDEYLWATADKAEAEDIPSWLRKSLERIMPAEK